MSETSPSSIDRRNFLIGGAVIGAGLYVGIRFAENRFGKTAATGNTLQPNAFVRVAPDDTVTVIIGKAEMGQGVYTGLAMVAAEELDVNPARVKVEMAGADPAFNVPFMPMQFTGGSMSTSTTYQPLREAGARARAMLLAAAAQRWGVDVNELSTDDGKVLRGGKSLSYGALADAASKLPVPEKVTLKDPAQLSLPRQAAEAPRFADEGGRQRQVRHRRPPARHVVCRHRAAAGGRRKAAQA